MAKGARWTTRNREPATSVSSGAVRFVRAELVKTGIRLTMAKPNIAESKILSFDLRVDVI
jgi:hypothetical protein